jgi:hypothetical protein
MSLCYYSTVLFPWERYGVEMVENMAEAGVFLGFFVDWFLWPAMVPTVPCK